LSFDNLYRHCSCCEHPVLLPSRLLWWQVGFGSPAPRAALEHVAVVQQAIEHSADGGRVTEQFAPVLDRPIRGQHGAGAFVAAHDDLQQLFGGGEWQLAHAQIVDYDHRHSHQELHVLFARAIERSVGQVIEQGVGFAIEHAVALLDGGLSDGLRQVTFARTRWT